MWWCDTNSFGGDESSGDCCGFSVLVVAVVVVVIVVLEVVFEVVLAVVVPVVVVVLFVVAVIVSVVVVLVIMVVIILVEVSVRSTMSNNASQFYRTFKEVEPQRTKNVIEEVALLHYGHEDFFNNFQKI
jgi:hypothetical protein